MDGEGRKGKRPKMQESEVTPYHTNTGTNTDYLNYTILCTHALKKQ